MILTAKDFEATDYDQDVLKAEYLYNGTEITIALYNGEDNMDEILADIHEVVSNLASYDERGKRLIIDELYDAYNEDDTLTEEEFKSQIGLISLYFTGDKEAEFMYEGGEIFGGHFLAIELKDGFFEDGVAVEG